MITVSYGMDFIRFSPENNPKGNCALLAESSFPIGLRGLQHLLCKIDIGDLRPSRGGSSLSVQLARQPFEGPGLSYRLRSFGRLISQEEYDMLLAILLKYLKEYDAREYAREMREYISGQIGLLIPMCELEKLYQALLDDNQVGEYFYPIPDRFWTTFLKVYDFQHLTPEQLLNPSQKTNIGGVKLLRKIFRDSYEAHDFRYKG